MLLALPLARLDYPDAVLVWNLVSLATFLAALAIVARVLSVPRSLILPGAALITFCHSVYGNLYLGQLTLVLVFLVTAVWALDRSGRPGAAGPLLGLAMAIKVFPAYLLVYFALQRRFWTLVTAVVTFTLLNFVAVVVLGWNSYEDYLGVVLPELTRFRSFGFNVSIAGIWYKLFDPIGECGLIAPLWSSPALALWGTLGLGPVHHRDGRGAGLSARTPEQRDLAFGAAATGMLLVSPVTWDFSLPCCWSRSPSSPRPTIRSQWMPAALVLLLTVLWVPQGLLVALAEVVYPPHEIATPAYMLGAVDQVLRPVDRLHDGPRRLSGRGCTARHRSDPARESKGHVFHMNNIGKLNINIFDRHRTGTEPASTAVGPDPGSVPADEDKWSVWLWVGSVLGLLMLLQRVNTTLVLRGLFDMIGLDYAIYAATGAWSPTSAGRGSTTPRRSPRSWPRGSGPTTVR